MKKNKFDTHARNMLDGLETPINTDALWDNVQAELYPEKKKRKFGWIWFSASSFLAVLLLLGYMYISNTSTSEKNIVLKDKVDQKLEANIESQKINTTTSNVIPSETSVNKIESKEEPQKNESSVTNNKVTRQNNSQREPNTKITKLNLNDVAKNKLNTSPENTPYRINVPQAKNMINSSILNTKATEIQEIKIDGPINDKTNNLKTETKSLQRNEAPSEIKIDTSSIKVIESETPELIIAAEEDVDENLEEPTLNIPEDGGDDNDEVDIYKRNFQFGVGIRAGISNSFTTLNTESDELLLNFREESESNLETIDLGLDVLIKHKSGVYLSTGIDYLRSARKVDYNKEVLVDEELINGTRTIFINPITMDSTFEQGQILQTTTRTDIKKIYNNLHLINIPISLGFARGYKRWTFGVQGGTSFNVYLRQKGQIRINEVESYDLGEDNLNWFKDNLDVSFQGAALVGYNFTDNFQIVGGPSFRSRMTLSESINPIRQSQVGLGAQVSARYWFD